MRKSRFTEEQIIGILKESEAGAATKDLLRRHGISHDTFYRWKKKFGGLEVGDARRLKQLEDENRRREGWPVSRKRVQRLYREEGLAVRRKGKRGRSQAPRPVRGLLATADERWSLDFVPDTLSSGRTFRCPTVLDEFTREAMAVDVAHSKVIEVLEHLHLERGCPR